MATATARYRATCGRRSSSPTWSRPTFSGRWRRRSRCWRRRPHPPAVRVVLCFALILSPAAHDKRQQSKQTNKQTNTDVSDAFSSEAVPLLAKATAADGAGGNPQSGDPSATTSSGVASLALEFEVGGAAQVERAFVRLAAWDDVDVQLKGSKTPDTKRKSDEEVAQDLLHCMEASWAGAGAAAASQANSMDALYEAMAKAAAAATAKAAAGALFRFFSSYSCFCISPPPPLRARSRLTLGSFCHRPQENHLLRASVSSPPTRRRRARAGATRTLCSETLSGRRSRRRFGPVRGQARLEQQRSV